ncbi:MAG: GAF domain-containing protein, partial [Leifsonia sp.]
RAWHARMGALLEAASSVPRVFAVGLPDVTWNVQLPAFVTRIIRRRLAVLNDDLRQLAGRFATVRFVAFEPKHPAAVTPFGTTGMYDRWVDAVAPSMATGLVPLAQLSHGSEPVDRAALQRALDSLDLTGEEDDGRVHQLTRLAHDLLGASGATVNFVVGDQSLTAAGVPADHGVALDDSFFGVTVGLARLFVVEDALNDPRFAHHPWVVGEQHVRFYAGYPIEAPDGIAVGALSIVDTEPRTFGAAEHALLRELALQVQAALWAHPSGQPSWMPVPAA